MRFQIPQFIETEIKLVGPFTLKQFLWIAAGAMLIFLDFSLLKGFGAFVIALPIGGISLALAFLKVEGITLIEYISNALGFAFGPKKYIFKQDERANQSDYMGSGPRLNK